MSGSSDSTRPGGRQAEPAISCLPASVQLSQEDLHRARGPLMRLDERVPEGLGARGALTMLDRRIVGLFCSQACPETLSENALEMAESLAAPGLAVASGFHSPVESAVLSHLLALKAPAILCLGRAVETAHLPRPLDVAMRSGELLLLSHFSPSVHRLTAGTAARRNRLVAALADDLLIIHASSGGKIESLCREAITWGKPIFTLNSPHNEALLSLGARPISPATARLELILNG